MLSVTQSYPILYKYPRLRESASYFALESHGKSPSSTLGRSTHGPRVRISDVARM